MSKLPVIAAIANYNMAKELEHLLPQVVGQGYDEVFVLDDASTDNSREVVQKFKGVRLVAGETNKGAGANRNRILGALRQDAIVHFLDADVDLETEHTAELVRKVVPEGRFGFVGGLIKDRAGRQMVWNYGSGAGMRSSFAAQLQFIQGSLLPNHPKLAARLRRMFKKVLADWPDPFTKPVRREIYWAAEANIVVRSDIFASLGGFDEYFRETEILDLAIRMEKQGLPRYFDPLLAVRHTEGKVRNYNRSRLKIREIFRTARHFGLLKWLVADGKVRSQP